nr:hypothetical protein [Tanacetum cinerariifolium]
MGYEKPSTKLAFYKACFSSQWNLVRNVDSTSKLYMYPRFIQLPIKKQLGDLSTYTTKYTSPALTQKVFANMRRVGKGFSRVETPLFKGMLVEQVIGEGGDEEEHVQDVVDSDAAQGANTTTQGDDTTVQRDDAPEPTIPSPTPPTPPPQPPQDLPLTSQLKRRVKKLEKGNRVKVLKVRRKIDELDEDDDDDVALMDDKKEKEAKEDELAEVQEEFVADPSRRRKGVVIRNLEEESTTSSVIPADTKSKDKGKGIMIEEPKPLKKKQHVEIDEEYVRKLHAELNKYIN